MSKKFLTEECKRIWSSYTLRTKISEQDKNWLIENVFSHHPEWEWWYNQGITDISVGRSNKFGSPCFYIHFIDGKSADISWVKSINNIK